MLQLVNITLQASMIRTVGKLPVRLASDALGSIAYDSSAGYVLVHVDGTITCFSTSSGDFSGQVFMVLA